MPQRRSAAAADRIELIRRAISWPKLLLLALACAALALLAARPSVHVVLLDAINACGIAIGLYPRAGPVLFIAVAALSSAVAFFSVAMIVPVAVVAWGTALTMIYLWAGWVLGGVLSYLGGRVFGRRLLLWLSPASFAWLQARIGHQTPFHIALLMQLLLPSELLGCAFGLARYRLKNYCAVLVLGELPYAVGAVLLGESFISARSGLLLGAGAVLVVVLLAAVALFHRRAVTGAAASI